MNESLQRITAWAKAHPALSIGIVAVLVLVGYLVSKRVGTSGGLAASGSDNSGLTTGGGGETPLPIDSTIEPVPGGEIYNPFDPGTVPTPISDNSPGGDYATTPTAFSGPIKWGAESTITGQKDRKDRTETVSKDRVVIKSRDTSSKSGSDFSGQKGSTIKVTQSSIQSLQSWANSQPQYNLGTTIHITSPTQSLTQILGAQVKPVKSWSDTSSNKPTPPAPQKAFTQV
jgi:hypothetical protein